MAAVFRLLVIMPVYNDWDAAEIVCGRIDSEFNRYKEVEIRILLVDDGSQTCAPATFVGLLQTDTIRSIHILKLKRNLGHQRAIAIALAYAADSVLTDGIAIMDADGEDGAEDIPRLLAELEKTGGNCVVFAARRKRFENRVFRGGYLAYRYVHHVLTGFGVEVGNFSIIPATHVKSLIVTPELWSHYAASVVKARIPFVLVPTNRGRRLSGQSHMNYVGLVTHGLSAISVFRELVGTRLLIAASGVGCIVFALLVAVVAIRIGTDWAIPGWATAAAGILIILLSQLLAMTFALSFGILANRDTLGFLPIRDYAYFIDGLQVVREDQPVFIRRD